MGQGSINLGLGGTPFVVQKIGVTGAVLSLRTHTLLSTTGGVVPQVLQQLIAVDALELMAGELLVTLEAVAQGPCQWVALHLPELSHLNACRVQFQATPSDN